MMRQGAARRAAARVAYRRWHAAAGPWAGYFRAVPLIAEAHGRATASKPRPTKAHAVGGAACTAELTSAGMAEGWLGRPDVLLVLDLPGALGVAAVAALSPYGVRPVLLVLLWPEPNALVPSDALLHALLTYAPASTRRGRASPAQFAFVLTRDRHGPAGATELTARFDNRYEVGSVDLPHADRLRQGGVAAVVACRPATAAPAGDLEDYLVGLEAGGMPVRRLALGSG